MRHLLCMLACLLAIGGARAADGIVDAACAARDGDDPAAQLAAVRGPIAVAIGTLDNARVTLPSPSLASGTVTYLDISPSIAQQLDKVCVLGYFELARGGAALTVPLVVESVQTVKDDDPHDGGAIQPSTRVYFRVPAIDDFGRGLGRQPFWKFWERDAALHLKVAAFAYADGVRGHVYFGRDLPVTVSSKGASAVAALLFAAFFYGVAGAAIGPVARAPDAGRRGRARWRRLLPWNITGSNGQASLSQLQMLLFTLIVATLLFYQWLRTGLLQDLSTDLLYLIGISTAGTAATQAATAIRKNLEPAIYQYVQQLGWFTAPIADAQSRGRPSGLLLTNKRFDIYKFQMLVFTCVIAAYVIASGADELGNVQISATLLTLMGMSQGAYVGGRAAADLLTPLQDQLRGMQALQQRYAAAADAQVREELRGQFRQAAAQAGAMFETMFGRVLPPAMLDLPPDADVPGAAAPAAGAA
ncbi:hypothetical protein NX784_02575 [Massilia pinisoli]|uniref:ABC transmembrane type-1 domain-containing protein n=1 Tax=Massilia pinisoli TaxID=1772194 RepID=A0ABT1ZKM4_9BURK|nr:hypothetical protein [Massilia pinisoli]MCS0580465.1 hypothetical protein [Massilia pinisoli]